MVGRGAGKNGYLSFESFDWTTPINGVKNYDVDIFATAEDQAKTSFEDVYNVLEDNKAKLGRFFTWNKEVITNLATGSRIRFRTSGVKTKDGGRPGAVVFDEFHAYENYKMVDVARTGLGKRLFPVRRLSRRMAMSAAVRSTTSRHKQIKSLTAGWTTKGCCRSSAVLMIRRK